MYDKFEQQKPFALLDTSKYPPEVAGRFNSFITTQFDDSLSVEMQMRSIIKWAIDNFKEMDQTYNDFTEYVVQGNLNPFIQFLNDLIDYMNEFIDTFDTKFQEEILNNLQEWYNDGTLETLINESLDTKYHEMDNRLTTQLAQTANEKVDKSSQPVNIKDFYSNGETDTQALNLALDEAITLDRKLYIPAGVYEIDEPIVKSMQGVDFTIEGEASGEGYHHTTLLWRGGEGTFITFNNIRYLKMHNIAVKGYDHRVDEEVFLKNTTGFEVYGNIHMFNCVVEGFEHLFTWRAGHYHKFDTCIFMHSSMCFNRWDGNNTIFDKCRVLHIDSFILIGNGQGPTTFINGSIECFTSIVFQMISGSYAKHTLNITNSYVENYPTTPVKKGLKGEFYENTIFIQDFSTVNLNGNFFHTDGMQRIIYFTPQQTPYIGTKVVNSFGNHLSVGEELRGTLRHYVGGASVHTMMANDRAHLLIPEPDPDDRAGGVRDTRYMENDDTLVKEASFIVDPFKLERAFKPTA